MPTTFERALGIKYSIHDPEQRVFSLPLLAMNFAAPSFHHPEADSSPIALFHGTAHCLTT